MGRRIDYLNGPDAPRGDSLVPSVNVAVRDGAGRLLLIRRSDNGDWALPGGAAALGERLAEAGVRETPGETGIRCEITGLVGVSTDPGHAIHHTSNDEVRQEFSAVLAARPVAGEPTPSSESTRGVRAASDEVDRYRIHPSMRLRVAHALADRTAPHIG
mgnify:CR=1 FL=1